MEKQAQEEKTYVTYETTCGVTLPTIEENKVYEVMVYKVSPDWEEFLRNNRAVNLAIGVPDPFSEDLLKKIAISANTMYTLNGIGIAANQVGFKDDWFIIDTQWHETGIKKPRVVINPYIIDVIEESTNQEEGCLSVPLGFKGTVKRSTAINITYNDLTGKEVKWIALDLDARAVQHEMGHLYGRLFIDYISDLRLSFLENKIAKAKKKAKNTIKNYNKNLIKQVKNLNIRYNWSEQHKHDLAEREAKSRIDLGPNRPIIVEQPNEQTSDF